MTAPVSRAPVLTLPGWQGSGIEHWQTRWERADRTIRRVQQREWDAPDPAEWVESIARAIAASPAPPVLVAHSLGCIAVAHYAAGRPTPPAAVAGALLVAPADVERDGAPAVLRPFAPIPAGRLPFPTVVVASHDDPYITYDRAESLARGWGSRLVDAGHAGHLNALSGHGPWPEGVALLDALRGGGG